MMLASFLLALFAAVPDALLALWLKFVGQGVLEHRPTLLTIAAIGMALSSVGTWLLDIVSVRVQRRFRDKVTIALEAHVAQLQASVASIAHHERPDYLDRLAMLRNQVFVLDHMYMSLFTTCGWILRLGITIVLLASIHPALILLVLFAVPTVLTSSWRPAVERAAQERGAPANRLARHLFTTATTASPGKEVRVTGIGDRLMNDRRRAWEQGYRPIAAARWGSAVWYTLAWAVFGSAYIGAVDVRRVGTSRDARRNPARARGRFAAVVLRQRGGRRNRIPPRVLDGRFAPARLARGLRRVARQVGRFTRAPHVDRGHPPRSRVVCVSGHVPPGPRRCVPRATGRLGHRRRRRKRRGQDDAGQAAGKDVRAIVRRDLRGRETAGAHTRRRMAPAARRRLSGFLPLRVPRQPHGRRRRRAAG